EWERYALQPQGGDVRLQGHREPVRPGARAEPGPNQLGGDQRAAAIPPFRVRRRCAWRRPRLLVWQERRPHRHQPAGGAAGDRRFGLRLGCADPAAVLRAAGRLREARMMVDPADFSPPLLRIQEKPPAPLAGWMLRLLLALLAGLLLWAAFGRLDIVAVAEGKLVPSSYLKIVQPAEQGTKAKLEQVLPHYIEQEKAFEKLTKDGFSGRLMYTDKQRERIEKEQDLRAQEFTIGSNQALIEQSRNKIAQITADYRRQLQT